MVNWKNKNYFSPSKGKGAVIFLIILLLPGKFWAQQNFKEWTDQEEQQFKQFLEKRDQEFIEFLKKEWQEFSLTQGIVPDQIPKPGEIPRKNFEEINIDLRNQKSKVKDFKIKSPPEKGGLGFIKRPTLKFQYGKRADFVYLNTPCNIMYDLILEEIDFPDTFNNTDISKFWGQMSKTQYTYLLEQCAELKQNMRLNDWAFYKFLSKFSQHIFPQDNNIRELFTWFLMQKDGYDVKVGYIHNQIFLLISSQNVLYNHPFIQSHQRRYYTLADMYAANREKKIITYEGGYPEAQAMLNLNIYYCPVVNPKIIEKTLKFNYLHTDYSLSLNINKSIVDFYSEYPLTEYVIYFNAPISPECNYSLLNNLKPLILGKSKIEAVNLVLHFVQKSFKYTSDYEQFGDEKPLFIEETLYYPGSDCEDRAVLFAYLIRNLLNLEVIGLDYPGHIATAVKIGADMPGKKIYYSGNDYIVCDPTYINANMGQCLPKYLEVDPEIIPLYHN